jgi:hypothetical protein
MNARSSIVALRPSRGLKSAVALQVAGAALLLAGCAQSQMALQPGDDAARLEARLGQPAEVYPLPDGGKRLMWPTQPFGETTVVADVSADGAVQNVRQVLQPGEFSRAQVGTWTKQDVLTSFGRPVESAYFPLTKQEVWSYRYQEAGGAWKLLYNFYFDRGGVLRMTQKSPDTLNQNGDGVF